MRTVPEKSAAPPLDLFSSMLKDTTGQHRAHLFDLNCKICTGKQVRGGRYLTLLTSYSDCIQPCLKHVAAGMVFGSV